MDTGITRIVSQHSVAQTMERLESLLKERGVMIFAHIDFSGDAALAANLAAVVPLIERAASG